MTTIITATDAAQFLGLVPHLLGFHPSESVVLVPFAGRRSLGAVRLDLEHASAADEDATRPVVLLESPADAVDRIAATAIGMVCRLADADAVAVVVYTDEPIARGRLPREQLARAVARRADACGIELRDALCVASTGWASFLEADHPEAGHPLDLIESADTAGALPPVAPGDQHAGADLPVVDPTRLADVAAALDALTAAVVPAPTTEPAGRAEPAARADPRALETLTALDDIPEFLEDLLVRDAASLPPFEAARAALCLSRPAVRDIALLQWSGSMRDGDAALAAQLHWETGAPYPEDLGARVWGDGPTPDPDRLAAGLAVARECAALTTGTRRAAVLGLCAWLAWAQGRSTVAADYAAQATAIDADAGLAEIVLAFVTTAHLPDWAFQHAAA
ncbi:hypothetical protein LK09_14520 [Microbacterium mangrovi]|uniref:Lipopolysaccharide biosynthesis protein n=1 Tax=Microbacterium mangrovi TaxID=1348253 RepID=A0A0B2A4M9_9MICO|nr:DUF4192 family protein [Microbacterium mangrovi]KHK96557.1 hypothetical protein LK09_14520 [Microbacterium mangrovi]